MLGIIKRVLKLADEYAYKIKWAIFFSFLQGIIKNVPFFALLYLLIKILENTLMMKDVWLSLTIIVVSLFVEYLLKKGVFVLQSGTGFEIFARERIKLGDRLKRVPMGYFKQGNLGDITSVITSDITFIEMFAMDTIDTVVVGYLDVIMGCAILFVLDWRISLLSIIIIICAAYTLKKIQSTGIEQAEIRQEGISQLTKSCLEFIQGISVMKSFQMKDEKSDSVRSEFRKFRDISITLEKKFTPSFFKFETWFSIGISATVFTAISLLLYGRLELSIMLIITLFIFRIYAPYQALSAKGVIVRIMEAALNRYEKIMNIDIIDANGKDIPLENFDIEFKEVTFSYEKREILKNINLTIPEKSMTALVGLSGSGKTTMVNLIARFWDIQKGQILIGGRNIKELTCDSLLSNISMVFQNVYLFNDTIYNNIQFGNPNATHEQIIEASKKARCHEFISKLEKGYETILQEGGNSLSGGEKQRISIARAILKNAPIVLLDEATSSVDPENEKHIQNAISELVKNKTLIVIAHRLSTVKNADQIIVLDDGKIIQKGKNEDLIKTDGKYKDLWERRMKARSWQISL